jgi:hypothetical protein
VVQFLEGKLDELYTVLRGPRYAEALVEAKWPLWDHDYREALRLVQSAREAYAAAPAAEWEKRAAARFGGPNPGKELARRLAVVLDVLEKAARSQPAPAAPLAGPPLAADFGQSARARPAEAADVTEPPARPLGPGAFTKLLTAARQSGVVPRADAISMVRDHEFPAGHYRRSLEVLEGLYAELNTHAERWAAGLRREETLFRAGTLKMSPKDWLLRQRRAREQDEKIGRARRHFTRVIENLRALCLANPE